MRRWQDNLRDLMRDRGINQAELARRLDVVPSSVSHYFTGRVTPPIKTLKRIADVLGVTVADIIKDDALITESDEERQLIELLRSLTEEQQAAAIAMLKAMQPPSDDG